MSEGSPKPFKDLLGSVVKTEKEYFAVGGYGELWKGLMTCQDGSKVVVAMKILRGVHLDLKVLEKTIERIYRKTYLWHRLQHPNILPFLGVCSGIGPSPALISPYYDFGDVVKYLNDYPDADRLNIVNGVANGLQYLHSPIHCYNDSDESKAPIIHGDLKGGNILIDDTGNPRLCDFDRAKLLGNDNTTTTFGGSIPFMAPEVVPSADDDSPEESTEPITETTTFKPTLTRESDIYAFAMVVIEITSGKTPFYHLHKWTITRAVEKGSRPRRTRHPSTWLTDDLWVLLTECWDPEPELRPDISAVVERLAKIC